MCGWSVAEVWARHVGTQETWHTKTPGTKLRETRLGGDGAALAGRLRMRKVRMRKVASCGKGCVRWSVAEVWARHVGARRGAETPTERS